MTNSYLAVDLGGTKIAAGVVNASGEVLARQEKRWSQENGPQGLIDQLVEVISPLLKDHEVHQVAGIASAGPVDQVNGVLLNPTNMTTDGKHWGVVEIVKPLSSQLGIPFKMENDAACAVLAERWVGEARNVENCMALTYIALNLKGADVMLLQ